LQEENEEIGAMASEGKVSPLILLPYGHIIVWLCFLT
jgi:hypothetical protein